MTRGYQYVPPRGIRTLAFFPSWWMRPWVLVWEHKGTKIFSYPIAPEPEAGASPARWLASTRRSATKAACGCCGA